MAADSKRKKSLRRAKRTVSKITQVAKRLNEQRVQTTLMLLQALVQVGGSLEIEQATSERVLRELQTLQWEARPVMNDKGEQTAFTLQLKPIPGAINVQA